jgi:hypothetical protein
MIQALRSGFSTKALARGTTFRDGHANTLTLMKDANRNIFGGFPPLRKESGDTDKVVASLRSFTFTMKNLLNVAARMFDFDARFPA